MQNAVNVRFEKWTTIAAIGGFIVALLIFSYRVVQGMTLFEMPDETEKFVVAQMISHGMSLYGDIFAHHGPLAYMLAHAYSIFISPIDFSYARYITAIFAILSAAAVFFSPLIKALTSRFIAVSLYLWLLSSVWIVHGVQFMLYHSLGGFLFVIAISQLLLPVFFGIFPGRLSIFVSSFSIGLAFFSAYSYGPAAALLTLIAFVFLFDEKKGKIKLYILHYFFGIFFSLLVVFIWLSIYGDIKGYFIYHFYLNQMIYAKFLEFNAFSFMSNARISLLPEMKIHSLAFAFSLCAMLFIAVNKFRNDFLRISLLFISICFLLLFLMSLNPRGEHIFRGGAFVVASFCLYSLSLCRLLEGCRNKKYVFLPAIIIIVIIFSGIIGARVARESLSSPDRIPRKDYLLYPAAAKPSNDAENDFIRYIVKKNERILVLVFDPKVYIHANRLPAIGHYCYFPWQAAYQRASIGGHKIDFCRALEDALPPLMIFDDWKVWYSFSMPQYEQCITEILSKNYVQLPYVGKFYIRRDRAEAYDLPLDISAWRLKPSSPVTKEHPIILHFDNRDNQSHGDLLRIGIRFGTYNRVNHGTTELQLLSNDGKIFRHVLNLEKLRDNTYEFIDVESRGYTGGTIRWLSGGGVSTWESESSLNGAHTCLIFEYKNGGRTFSKGCPLF